ncbi:hypothetical protein OG709_29875 [Streptomyces sp. NBC_01267]|uniref:aggregation-promoting factor C-terminal-like domain-containing protein n=1 Tax=Streptomyces sp. NBC_01267 TaxID=2903805 RepID=UPI002E319A00|nr:hypothetical protein [Streptomyces sp. NBC_01267]
MPDLDIVGSAAVDVVPIVPNFHTRLKALVLPIADKVGEEAGRKMGDAISRSIVVAIPDAINTGGKAGVRAAGRQGDDAGGAFSRSIRRKLDAAFKAMPKLNVKLGDTGVDAELDRIRAKMESLSTKRIGIDVSAEAAAVEVDKLEEKLRVLGAAHPNVAVRVDTAAARAALVEIRDEIAAVTATPGRVRLETDGTFGAKLRAVVAEAQASLPEINIDADTDPARAQIQSLRAQLAALSDARVGIDIDAATALAKIDEIKVKLETLAARSPHIDVRVDAAAASAQLAALHALADRGDTFNIRAVADTAGASSALMALGIQAAALVLIPAVPAALVGLGSIAAMATAAGAGLGALALAGIPAIKGVTEALAAKSAAEKDATTATSNGAKTMVQAQQRAIQMASAQQSLAAAHRNAARSIASSNQAVADAERSLAQASQRAADQRRTSAESVERAERSLSDAQRSAKQAEEALTQARADAAQQLKDLNDQLTDGALDQRDATLRVQEAQADLAKTLADPRSSRLQIERAQLAADQAVQNAKEQKQSYADLQKSAAAQQKAGISGNAAVKSAAQGVADAQRNVADQTKAVADAQREAARAQADAAQTVADAQRGVTKAVQAAADAQVSAADSIASAERGVQSARLSGIDTSTKAVTKTDELRKALAKLTPEQRDLYDSIAGPTGLKQAFTDWSKSLQPQTLPLFVRGVNAAKGSLPGLTPLVAAAADAIGSLFDKASANLKQPFWKSFKKDIDGSAKPAIVGIGTAFGNVLKGVAGMIDAFLPHMDGIVKESDKVTGRFARWGSSLKGSPAFEKFLAYVKSTAPGLASFLGKVLSSALDLSKAISPLSGAMFTVLAPLFDAISWVSTNFPGAIQLLWGLYAANKAVKLGMLALAGASAAYEIAMAGMTLATAGWGAAVQATGIVPVIEAIVLVIALLVIGVIYAYKHFTWFRVAVDTAWAGIKVATMFLWDAVLKPTFDAIWWALQKVGAAAMWLWKNAIKPAFDFIAPYAKMLFTALVVVLLTPAYLAFKLLGATASWLWKNAIKPSFNAIGAGATWLWKSVISPVFGWIGDKATWLYDKAIKPAFRSIKGQFSDVGTGAKWLWSNAIKPVFGWIGDKASWLYNKGIKPPFDAMKKAVASVASSFGVGRDSIRKAWDEIAGIAKKPVKFVVDHVYNEAIVPLWNNVARITGAKKLTAMKGYATGGVIPGYTPGRDNQLIAVGGGEAIMRPEVTRAVGAGRIHALNAAARGGGVAGVQRAISAGTPAFKDGGIVGWFKDKGKAVGDFVSGAADSLNPTRLFSQASNAVSNMMDPIRKNPWSKEIAKLPMRMLSGLKDQALGWLSGGGGDGGANVARGLAWAKTQNGKPYQWGGNGNPSWDCSGFMSAIESVIRGQAPHRRWATGAFSGDRAPAGWVHNLAAPFQIGVTNKGVGHTAGTLAGVNVESRAGGIHVGKSARGAHDSYFDGVYGFRPSIGSAGSATATGPAQTAARQMLGEFGWGDSQWAPLKALWQHESGWRVNAQNPNSPAYGIPQALPGSKMASVGSDWRTNPLTQIKWGLGYIKGRPDYGSPAEAWSKWQARSPHWYDNGGYLQPGLNLVANGTGQPEPVFTSGQWDDIRSSKAGSAATQSLNAVVHVYVGDREITDIVDTRIEMADASAASDLNTGRWI